jgi:Xaa-Pro aminopeptidase
LKVSDKDGFVEQFRMIKDDTEVAKIEKALAIHKDAYKYLSKIIKPGLSEEDILYKLEEFVRANRCKFSFLPIIASGPNSSLPHAKITKRKIAKNDVILVDIGIEVESYKSDLTRMFFLGRIPALIKEVEEIVRAAQKEAIKIIRPGISASEVDAQARNYLKEHKLDSYFKHSLGHGVGLEIHERPRLSPRDKTILQEGMIITVEPGVYIPGKFGIRIEDMVLVTKKGNRVLSDNIN